MSYDDTTKAGRMTQVRDRLNNGFIDVLNAVGTVLCTWPLDATSGGVAGPVLTFSGFPKTAQALAASTSQAPAASARLRAASGTIVKAGLTVGLSGAQINLGAMIWGVNDNITLAAAPTLTHAA